MVASVCTAGGVKRIRIHSIRHSYIRLLIEVGGSAVVIADRVGYEGIDIVHRYAHVFSTMQVEVVNKLNSPLSNPNKNIEKQLHNIKN